MACDPTPIPELEALSQLLRDSRQAQGLSLAALAQRLYMGLEQLEALEQGDRHRIPEPVFVIAQARRIADALGLDISAQIEALRASERFMAGRPELKTSVFQAAADRQTKAPEPIKTNPKAHSTGRSGAAGAMAKRGLGQPVAWTLLLAGFAAAGVWVANSGTTWRQLARPQPQPEAPPVVALKPAPAPAMDLQISSSLPSWLEVRPTAGGAPLFRGTFVGERRFPLGQGLSVRAGRPDLVQVALGTTTARPLGSISQVRWVRFEPSAAKPGSTRKPNAKIAPAPASRAKPIEPAKPAAAPARERPATGLQAPAASSNANTGTAAPLNPGLTSPQPRPQP